MKIETLLLGIMFTVLAAFGIAAIADELTELTFSEEAEAQAIKTY